jgi:hypothetical protein
MKTIPAIGSRVRVGKVPKGWGLEAQSFVGTTGIVRVVCVFFINCPIIGVEFPDWTGGHRMLGTIRKTSGWYFILQWLEQ